MRVLMFFILSGLALGLITGCPDTDTTSDQPADSEAPFVGNQPNFCEILDCERGFVGR